MSEQGTEKTRRSQKIDLESNPTFARYIVTSKSEIQGYLRALADKTRMVTVYQKSGEEFFLATLLGIDPENDQVYLERSRIDPAWLKELDDDFLCSSDIDRVQMQFTLKSPYRTEFQGEEAWGASTPATLVRLQRREFFRLSIPMAKPVFCNIKGLPASQEDGEKFQLADISGSGMGFSAPITHAEALQPGQEYSDCELALPGEPAFTLGITIRNVYEVTSRSGIRTLRIGAEFTAINTARVNLIQRYITGIERERRARAAGDF